MSDDQGLTDYLFKTAVGVLMAIGAAWCSIIGKKTEKNQEDLAEYKVTVAEKYTTKDTLERIHDRMDDMSNDIKELLQKVG